MLNLTAIAANGGVMPASARHSRPPAGTPPRGTSPTAPSWPHPRLGFLGDVFATPPWLPVHSVFSVGDVVIVVGVALFLGETCRTPVPDQPAVEVHEVR